MLKDGFISVKEVEEFILQHQKTLQQDKLVQWGRLGVIIDNDNHWNEVFNLIPFLNFK